MAEVDNKIYYASKYSGEDIDEAIKYFQDLKTSLNIVEYDKEGNVTGLNIGRLQDYINDLQNTTAHIISWINGQNTDYAKYAEYEAIKDAEGNIIEYKKIYNPQAPAATYDDEGEDGVKHIWYDDNNFERPTQNNPTKKRWVIEKNQAISKHSTEIADLQAKFGADGTTDEITKTDGIVSQNTKNIAANEKNIQDLYTKFNINEVTDEVTAADGIVSQNTKNIAANKKDIQNIQNTIGVKNDEDNYIDSDSIMGMIHDNEKGILRRLDLLDDTQLSESLINTVNKTHKTTLDDHEARLKKQNSWLCEIDGGLDDYENSYKGFLDRERFEKMPEHFYWDDEGYEQANEDCFFSFDLDRDNPTDRTSLYSMLDSMDQAIEQLGRNIQNYLNPELSEYLDVNVTNILE